MGVDSRSDSRFQLRQVDTVTESEKCGDIVDSAVRVGGRLKEDTLLGLGDRVFVKNFKFLTALICKGLNKGFKLFDGVIVPQIAYLYVHAEGITQPDTESDAVQ